MLRLSSWRRILFITLAVAAGLVLVRAVAMLAIGFLGVPGLVPSHLGSLGYAWADIPSQPRPVGFERPSFWDDVTPELPSGVLVHGPHDRTHTRFVTLAVKPYPSSALGGRYASLSEFAAGSFPKGHQIVSTSSSRVAGKDALELTYTYNFIGGAPHFPIQVVPSRGRSVFFEDRGHYYELTYSAAEEDYDRYFETFEHMIGTFRFID